MLGIDIYRYQTVTDWTAVKRHGVSFVYVKGTDGSGPARVRADTQARGAQGAGLPVGLYHYAQLAPHPEEQADILADEVRRLGADGLPPALDLESPFVPGPLARAFAQRFILRLYSRGFERVTLYANTTMLTGIGADALRGPNLWIWAANYGSNDGRRHTMSYRGHVDIHQYTSRGRVPGIDGDVDLNEFLSIQLGDTMSVKDITDSWYEPRFRGERNYAQVIHNIEDMAANAYALAAANVDRVTRMEQHLATLVDRETAHVNVEALAAELVRLGAGGLSAAQLVEVIQSARVSVIPPGID